MEETPTLSLTTNLLGRKVQLEEGQGTIVGTALVKFTYREGPPVTEWGYRVVCAIERPDGRITTNYGDSIHLIPCELP